MTDVQATPGWFGKLSSLGDFASRRLAPEWVSACDEWLSRCVDESRRSLGDAWLDAYLNAPVWRFAWGPGVAGSSWWFGVMMASCDNVGRYFPLLVAHPRPRLPSGAAGLDHLDAWWAHVAGAAMDTLSEGHSVDGFEQALAAAPPWPEAAEAAVVQPLPTADGRWRGEVGDGASTTQLVQALARDTWADRMHGHTLWWPLHAGRTRCVLMPALPSGAQFAEMLLGGG
ncbi:MAG: type VI secretion system-associated protein TagF [Rubrivivax sp.]|nr:type VI secretion system-associated protein TagF [Rubrivivax sp.]